MQWGWLTRRRCPRRMISLSGKLFPVQIAIATIELTARKTGLSAHSGTWGMTQFRTILYHVLYLHRCMYVSAGRVR